MRTYHLSLYAGKRKVHFLMKDGKEMVEEYNLDTNVVVHRMWKKKTNIGQDVGWSVEIGDPPPTPSTNIEMYGMQESSSTVRCIYLLLK